MQIINKEYYISKQLQNSVRDLLLLYCWEKFDSLLGSMPIGNPQVFTLTKALGRSNTQMIIHQVHEDRVIRGSFRTTKPEKVRLLIYDLGDAYVMISEQEEKMMLAKL